MSSRSMPSTFLKNVLQNGIGRHVCQLQRVTITFCKEFRSSNETREFIESHALSFAKANPGIVLYLKPKRHAYPYLKAEYLNGYEETISLSKLKKDQIAEWLGVLKGRSGTQLMRIRKDWHTDTPSIQGVWHPFMFKDTALNVTDMTDRKLHDYMPPAAPATELMIHMQKEQKVSDVYS